MSGFDPVIHPITRLKICAALRGAGAVADNGARGGLTYEMKFAALKRAVGVSDATLSKQLGHLEEAGYVTRHREWGSARSKDVVWVTLTAKGQRAYAGHLAALREIAEA